MFELVDSVPQNAVIKVVGVGGGGVNGVKRTAIDPVAIGIGLAVAAIAAAVEMGIDPATIARGLAKVEPADMRLERIEIAGRAVYNDAYNANPDSVRASLQLLGNLFMFLRVTDAFDRFGIGKIVVPTQLNIRASTRH